MKKITAALSVLLILSLCLTFAACSNNSSDTKATEAATEKATEAPTEKPTEKPTEAPTEKPTEAAVVWDEDAEGYLVKGVLVYIDEINDDISSLSGVSPEYLPDVDQWVVLTLTCPDGISSSDLGLLLKCITVEDCEFKLDSQVMDPETYKITTYRMIYGAPAGYEISMDKVHVDLP